MEVLKWLGAALLIASVITIARGLYETAEIDPHDMGSCVDDTVFFNE